MIYVVRDLRFSPPRITMWVAAEKPPCDPERPFDPHPQVTWPRQGIKLRWWFAALVVGTIMWLTLFGILGLMWK